MKTAREFLDYAGEDCSEENLYLLGKYVGKDDHFLSFPDAFVYTEDGEPLSELPDEPVAFQEYLETQKGF